MRIFHKSAYVWHLTEIRRISRNALSRYWPKCDANSIIFNFYFLTESDIKICSKPIRALVIEFYYILKGVLDRSVEGVVSIINEVIAKFVIFPLLIGMLSPRLAQQTWYA